MKINEILSVAIRIMGLLLFFVTLRDAPQWIRALGQAEANNSLRYFQYGMMASFFLASFFMVKFPGVISSLLLTPSSKDSPLIEENGQAIQIAGLTIVGVYILTWAVPDFFYNLLLLWQLRSYEYPGDRYNGDVLINQGVTVIEIGFGAYLALGSRGLTNFINRFRA